MFFFQKFFFVSPLRCIFESSLINFMYILFTFMFFAFAAYTKYRGPLGNVRKGALVGFFLLKKMKLLFTFVVIIMKFICNDKMFFNMVDGC